MVTSPGGITFNHEIAYPISRTMGPLSLGGKVHDRHVRIQSACNNDKGPRDRRRAVNPRGFQNSGTEKVGSVLRRGKVTLFLQTTGLQQGGGPSRQLFRF